MTSRDAKLATLLSSAILVLAGTVFSSFSKLLERVIIGRALSPEAYGEVSIGLAIMTLGATASLVGLDQGIPRYMSRFDREREVRGVWLTGVVIAVGTGTAVSVALLVGSDFVASLVTDQANDRLLSLFFLSIPLIVGLDAGICGLQGMEHTRYRTYIEDLLYPVSRIVLLLVLLAVGMGVLAAGFAYLIAAMLAFLGSHVLLNRLMPLRGSFDLHASEMMRFSAPLLIAGILDMLLVQTDTLMLGYFRPSAEVGLYNAAYPLAYGVTMLLTAFGFIYYPMISRLDADDEGAEIAVIYRIVAKWVFVLTFPLVVVFVVFPSDVLAVFFGTSYAAGGTALAILTVGFFISTATGRNRHTISALGYSKVLMVTSLVAFTLNVVLNLLLIPRYGSTGAAVTSTASNFALNVILIGVLYSWFDISLFSKPVVRTYLLLPVVVVPTVAIGSRWITMTAFTFVPALVVIGIASLVVAAVGGGLQAEDRVALRFVEERIGIRIPYIRRYIPQASDASVSLD